MILKKPYAFLIKHFRLIHLVLSALLIFIAYRINVVYNFFSTYVANGNYNVIYNKPSEYVGLLLFLALIGVIIITIIIYLLMRFKKKPKFLYLVTLIYYTVLFIYLIITYNFLDEMGKEVIATRNVMLVRDFLFIAFLIQCLVCIVMIVRGLGFDVKKFNFRADLAELDIKEEDSEEFEFTLGLDRDTLNRRIRRNTREFRYFFQENKLFVTIFVIIIILAVSIPIGISLSKKEIIYNEQEIVDLDDTLSIKINNTYVTKNDYTNNIVADRGYTFVVLDVSIINNSIFQTRFDLSRISLVANDMSYFNNTADYEYFSDLGIGYNGQYIEANSSNNYVILFKMAEVNSNKDMIFEYYSNKTSSNKTDRNIVKITLSKKEFGNIKNVDNKNMNEELIFANSVIPNAKFIVNSYDINDFYSHQYDVCISVGNCIVVNDNIRASANKTILRLDTKFNLESSNSGTIKSSIDLISTLANIKYIVSNIEMFVKPVNKTPNTYKGNYSFFEVNKDISNADSIEIVFTIRDKQYTYKIK